MSTDDTPAEPSFKYRRFYAFASLLLTSAGLAFILCKIDAASELRWLGLALIGSNLVVCMGYLLGASAVDLALITKAWKGKE